MLRLLLVFGFCVSLVLADSINDVYEKCGDNMDCAEKGLIGVIDEYDNKPSVPVWGNFVTVERTKDETVTRGDEDLFDRVLRYLSSHTLKFRLPKEVGRSLVEESRRKRIKLFRKLLLPLLIFLKLKAAVVIPAVISAIAFVAFRGLEAGLLALLLAGANSLKNLVENQDNSKKVSFEVVPPHWSRTGLPVAAAAAGGVPPVSEWSPYYAHSPSATSI